MLTDLSKILLPRETYIANAPKKIGIRAFRKEAIACIWQRAFEDSAFFFCKWKNGFRNKFPIKSYNNTLACHFLFSEKCWAIATTSQHNIFRFSTNTESKTAVQHTNGFMHVNSMLVISVKYLVISVNMCSYAPIYIKLGPSILDPTITPLLICSLSHLNWSILQITHLHAPK
jgi:hypothetical protein